MEPWGGGGDSSSHRGAARPPPVSDYNYDCDGRSRAGGTSVLAPPATPLPAGGAAAAGGFSHAAAYYARKLTMCTPQQVQESFQDVQIAAAEALQAARSGGSASETAEKAGRLLRVIEAGPVAKAVSRFLICTFFINSVRRVLALLGGGREAASVPPEWALPAVLSSTSPMMHCVSNLFHRKPLIRPAPRAAGHAGLRAGGDVASLEGRAPGAPALGRRTRHRRRHPFPLATTHPRPPLRAAGRSGHRRARDYRCAAGPGQS